MGKTCFPFGLPTKPPKKNEAPQKEGGPKSSSQTPVPEPAGARGSRGFKPGKATAAWALGHSALEGPSKLVPFSDPLQANGNPH